MLDRHLIDSASARLASQTAKAAEKLHPLQLVAGETINTVHSNRFAILNRRASRPSSTEELATALRAKIYQFRRSPLASGSGTCGGEVGLT